MIGFIYVTLLADVRSAIRFLAMQSWFPGEPIKFTMLDLLCPSTTRIKDKVVAGDAYVEFSRIKNPSNVQPIQPAMHLFSPDTMQPDPI